MKKRKLLKWAEALESGKYQQCYLKNRDKDHFCAIGVAIDLNNLWEDGFARKSLCKIYGIDKKFLYDIQSLNDHEKLNFVEIAQWIREKLKHQPSIWSKIKQWCLK